MRFAPKSRAALLLIAGTAAQAQPGPVANEIVVTGRALPATRGDASFARVSIDAARLNATASGRLEDALRDVGGVQQFRRSDARSANPTSQGVTLRGLGGNAAARALVLLDGVPQGDPFGGFIAWPLYDGGRIGRVTVTRGGGSGIAGPGALAGTIELFSIDSATAPFHAASVAVGSRASVEGRALASARLGDGFGMASLTFARGDGFVPVVSAQRGPVDIAAPYRQLSAALRAVVPVTLGELQASLQLFDDTRSRGTGFSENGTRGADASVRLVGKAALPFDLLGYVQLRHFSSRFASIDATRSVVTPTLDQYATPATGMGARIELRPLRFVRMGADLRHVAGETREAFGYVAGTATRLREAGGSATTFGGFIDGDWTTRALTLTGGARLDRWAIGTGRLIERVSGTSALQTDSRFAPRSGWQATGRVGADIALADALKVRGAAYAGWRLPTLNELYRPFRVGADATAANAALAPETSRGIEFGATFARRRMTATATVFVNRLNDAIANVQRGRGPGVFPGVGFVAGAFRQRTNVAAIASRGVEVDVRWTAGDWALNASLSHADARVRARGEVGLDGLRPAGVAPLQASATLGWRGFALTTRYVSAQFDDDQNLRRLAPAFTIDAVADVPVTAGLKFVARIENAFDATVAAAMTANGTIERAAPRTIWLGMRYR